MEETRKFRLDLEILEYLSAVTAEEQAILDGNMTIDRDRYSSGTAPVVNAEKLLEKGKLITIRPHTRFIAFPEHSHDYVEVVYMCRGTTTHIVNGKEIVLKAGELLFLGQSARQAILPAGKDDIAVNFIILPQFFNQTLTMIGEEETPLRRFILDALGKNSGGGYLYFKTADLLPVQNLIENLLWTLIRNTPNKRNLNQTTMGLLLMHLLNSTDTLSYEDSAESSVLRLIRYVEENYRDGSLTRAAELLHCDLYWLSREIKRKTGHTYTELVQEKRLSQAAFLLRSTAMSVSQIAQAVGYENISYFHRLFFARFGVSPRSYRICK